MQPGNNFLELKFFGNRSFLMIIYREIPLQCQDNGSCSTGRAGHGELAAPSFTLHLSRALHCQQPCSSSSAILTRAA